MDPMGIILRKEQKNTWHSWEFFIAFIHWKSSGLESTKTPIFPSLPPHVDSQPTNWHGFALDERLPSLKMIWQKKTIRTSPFFLNSNPPPPQFLKIPRCVLLWQWNTPPPPCDRLKLWPQWIPANTAMLALPYVPHDLRWIFQTAPSNKKRPPKKNSLGVFFVET